MNVHEKVYKFKTKHRNGFTDEELEKLLKQFPTISFDMVSECMLCDAVLITGHEIIRYKHDVERAIELCLNNFLRLDYE